MIRPWMIGMGGSAPNMNFESTWNTENAGSASKTIVLPLVSNGTYDFYVDWGDGVIDHITAYNQAEVTHVYAAIQSAILVKIYGTIIGWVFNNAGDCLKIINISQWGCLRLGNTGNYFFGCANMTGTAIDALNTNGMTSLSYAFAVCNKWNQYINNWDVSTITDFSLMLYQCYVFNQPLSNFDMVSAQLLGAMLYATVAFNQSLASWDISAVTSLVLFNPAGNISTANYDATLISWGSQSVHDSLTPDFGNAKYTTGGSAEAARTHLAGTHGWTITDGGPA